MKRVGEDKSTLGHFSSRLCLRRKHLKIYAPGQLLARLGHKSYSYAVLARSLLSCSLQNLVLRG